MTNAHSIDESHILPGTRARPSWHHRLRVTGIAGLLVLVSGCAADIITRASVPEALVDKASVANFEHVRYWGDASPEVYQPIVQARIAAMRKILGPGAAGTKRVINFLTLSGGGSDGAYGAGFMNGWTASGTRPKFDAVTGISTGAMMAPLVFLGPKYDAQLKEAYTTLTEEDVLNKQVFAAVIGAANSLADTKPLEALIAKYTSAEMLAEIAEEYKKGRVLLIGTTNLDAQRSVIWDIGALAASGHPDALALLRKIILASGSIPGAFPPVPISVVSDGKTYEEMHVDGGVTQQVFLYPPGYTPKIVDKAMGWQAERHVYIIRNTKINPVFKATQDKLLPIAARSIATLIKTQGIGDLYRIRAVTQRDGIDFNFTCVPSDFAVEAKSEFDNDYMKALYQKGYDLAKAGYTWQKEPPGFDTKSASKSP